MSRRPLLCLLPIWLVFASFIRAEEEKPRIDRYGDPLPAHALARLGTVRFRHVAKILCLAYSTDSKIIASGGNDGMIVLWNAETGRKIRTLEGRKGDVRSLAFSPDCKLLVAVNEGSPAGFQKTIEDCWGELRVWDVASGKLVVLPQDTEESTRILAFLPDSKTLASYHSGTVCLWDFQTGIRKSVFTGKDTDNKWSYLGIAPNGKTLAVRGSGATIRFWDLPTRKILPQEIKGIGDLKSAAFSPDGTILAAAVDGGIRLYRVSNLEEIRRFPVQNGKISSLHFWANGKKLVTQDYETHTFRLWDTKSGKELPGLPKQYNLVRPYAISPDGRTVATAVNLFSGVIQLWDAETGEVRGSQVAPLDYVGEVAFLQGGKTVAARWSNNQVAVWSPAKERETCPLTLLNGPVRSRLCPDRSTVAATTVDGQLRLLELSSGLEIFHCPIAKNLEVLAVSANNKRAAFGVEGQGNQIWDLPKRKCIHQCDDGAVNLKFSPDGRMFVSGCGEQVRVWDLDQNKEVCRLAIFSALCADLAFSPDGRMIVVGNFPGSIRLFEIATGKERMLLKGHSGYVRALAFSPDGRTLASGGEDQSVRLWNIQKGKELKCFHGHLGTVHSVAFSPDGHRVVSGSTDTNALIWQIPASCLDRQPVPYLGRKKQDKLWGELADTDAARAYAALQHLAAAPTDAVSLSQERLFNATKTPPEQVQRWIAQLDDEEFTVREQASENLERVEAEAETALEKALKGDCSPEVQRRINALLETLKGKEFSIRVLRAVELLEQIGTPEAVDVLRRLEKKTCDAAVRDDVRRSLGRLEAKRGTP